MKTDMDLDVEARELLADSLKEFGCHGIAKKVRDGSDITIRTVAAIVVIKNLLRLG